MRDLIKWNKIIIEKIQEKTGLTHYQLILLSWIEGFLIGFFSAFLINQLK